MFIYMAAHTHHDMSLQPSYIGQGNVMFIGNKNAKVRFQIGLVYYPVVVSWSLIWP